MIVVDYDIILGCTGWDFPRPERVPLDKEEKYKIIHNFFNGRHKGKPLINFLTQLPKEDRKGKKQKTYEWQLKQLTNE